MVENAPMKSALSFDDLLRTNRRQFVLKRSATNRRQCRARMANGAAGARTAAVAASACMGVSEPAVA